MILGQSTREQERQGGAYTARSAALQAEVDDVMTDYNQDSVVIIPVGHARLGSEGGLHHDLDGSAFSHSLGGFCVANLAGRTKNDVF